ncbi:PAH-inducible cytochrome P450 monooxygenase PC-PAH 3 [Rickenella mellea]|uniref:PAH-inducible cytochrome P450 monooxygenase PC-PAH 3 n=1 Tax=Rickenella mellea TaxID=50990 RepID=A0A4Y7QGK1_9AGAM|nr:PAH-inducible cytochrome P450 monooxygenase PC-PAH 3 [Rickenella mellea]
MFFLIDLWTHPVLQSNIYYFSFIGAAVLCTTWLLSRRVGATTPPGPRGLPFIGNVLNIPSNHPWKIYQKWSRDNGSDLLFLRLPGHSLLILNSAKAAQDLLVQRSNIYSDRCVYRAALSREAETRKKFDRPVSTMLSDLMGMSWVFGLMQYGDQWKQHRKLFHREFTGTPAVRIHELNAARRLLNRLLTSSVNYARDMQLTTGDMILSATYGITPKSEDDYFIQLAESLVGAMAAVAAGGFLVDMLPSLRFVPKWFPGGGFKHKAEHWKRLGDKARTVPFDHVKKQLADGTATPSIASHFLESLQDNDLGGIETREQMQNILAEAYLGGAGATVGTLCSFVLAMSLYPDVQKKAQAAVDDALSGQRLPDFSDYGTIPYLDAVVNEVLRWHPGAPLGLFHAANKDDYYEGYLIPKGTMISPNVWAILHDESIYGVDTEDFVPERFLTADGRKRNDIPDTDIAFGFGRRICPGKLMGRETLWITAASILAVFQISDPVDREGKPLDPNAIEYTNSMSSRPPYFDCTIKLRNAAAESMVLDGINEG